MKVILRDHRPERPRKPYGLGLQASESFQHVAGGDRRRSSLAWSMLLHGAFIPLFIVGAELITPAPRWKPTSPVFTVIIRSAASLPARMYFPAPERSPQMPPEVSEALQPRAVLYVSPAQSADRKATARKFEVVPGTTIHLSNPEVMQLSPDVAWTSGSMPSSLDIPKAVRRDMALSQLPSAPALSESNLGSVNIETASVAVIAGSKDPKVLPSPPSAGRDLPVESPDGANRDAVPLKMVHPANGRFDVVVVQTSLADSLPETTGLMKGKPVYSVYVAVGDTKEWILHYCAADSEIVQRGAVVQLPDPTPLTAPYPAVTFRPAIPVAGRGSYLLVHGSMDESGIFRNLKVIGQNEPEVQELLAALSMWRFRPASRRDAPVPVEIVLAIPISKT